MTNSGHGARLPTVVLVIAGLSTVVAVLVSAMSIIMQLRNYRKPLLQRMVVRIMLMVPLYAIASLISLFSVEAAFFIDAIRDIYEAFVIYCFFSLLLSYLGGQRSLLIMMHGRSPKEPVFPINLFKHELDLSDPYTFLFLKRGILQYVQVKPMLAFATLILKATGHYNEGDFRANSGYLYVSIIYNVSICVALYCLALFWVCVNDDLKPFRPVPKFLCVKGVLFFSFWQSIAISVFVAAGIITKLGPYTDAEHISVGLSDLLICVEMPMFAFAHMYAFSYKDFLDPHHTFVARMRLYYAFRDSFGLKDVIEDTKATLRGENMDYRDFEPAEGYMHQGAGRDRRIRAGLRYSKGGKRKYWLPKAIEETQPPGRAERVLNNVIKRVAGPEQAETVTAPLLAPDIDDVVHLAPDLREDTEETIWDDPSGSGAQDEDDEDGYALPFGSLVEVDEELFAHSRKYLFGDYNYPVIDVSSESARTTIWDEEERVLRDERGAWFSPLRGAPGQVAIQKRTAPAWEGYGAVSHSHHRKSDASAVAARGSKSPEGGYGFPRVPREGNLIDHDAVRDTIPADKRDVSLHWTNSRRLGASTPGAAGSSSSSPYPRTQSPRIHISRAPASGSGSGSGSASASGSLSASGSPITRSRKESARRSPLPPDAVDLVVEDPDAADEERARERRKGEPATASALRKVYRRGYEVEVDGETEERGEVEVAEAGRGSRSGSGFGGGGGDPRRRVEVGEQVAERVEESGTESGSGWVQDVEGIVVRSGTPPLHARITSPQSHQYDIPEENPWA